MGTPTRSTIAALLTLLPSLAAQTYVVDAANGPGTNYTTLVAAVAAVPDGAVLLVRPGNYAGFTVAGKGFSVLGGAGVTVSGSIVIGGTSAFQGVTLRGLTWNTVPLADVIGLSNCQGPVLLEGITQPATSFIPQPTFPQPIPSGIGAQSCAQLYLRDCSIDCTVALQTCNAVIESCALSGENYAAIYYTSPPMGNAARAALTATNSAVQVAGNSQFSGGWGGNLGLGNQVPGGSGVRMLGGSLDLRDGTILGGVGGWLSPAYYSYTVESIGAVQLRISPRVVLGGAFGYPTNGPQSGADVMPVLTAASAPAGGTLQAAATTENGDLVVLAVGLPGPTTTLPGIQGAFWIEPGLHVFAAFGVQQAGTPIGASTAVPAGPAFLGLRLVWQAACYGPATGFQATNPAITVVH